MNIFEIKSQPEVNEKERTIIHYITTKDLDWGNDIVNPFGMNSSKYEKHRVVLYNHNSDRPIGKNLWLKTKEEGNIASTYFSKKSEFANEVFELHKEGIINTWSIRWTPLEKDGEIMEDALVYDKEKDIRYINMWELIEYSSAPLAMNYGAIDLVKGFAKSFELKEEIKKLELEKTIKDLAEESKKELNEIKSVLEDLKTDKERIQREVEMLKQKLLKSVEILGSEETKKLAESIISKIVAGEISRKQN